MATGNHVLYFRVSTAKQGADGHGIAAQKQAVAAFLNGGSWKVVGEFTEVESGKRDDRPELAKAIEACRLYGARLVVAKLDRLSRDIHFLTGLERAGIRFVAADMPEANEMVVHMMAVVAQAERKMISKRTKDALAAAKAKGVKLGGFRFNGKRFTDADHEAAREALKAKTGTQAARLAPMITELQQAGITSATGLAKALTERGIPTARGGEKWSTVQIQRVLARLAA
jgi:DNA invertase Pin-like site-specific DNA recombinase